MGGWVVIDRLLGDGGLGVLVGGLGKDSLRGGEGDDILFGARVTLDDSMLEDVRDIWTNGGSYASRVASLTTSLLTPNGTVLDDGIRWKARNSDDWEVLNTT